jgi:hypothetical protein
MSQSDLTEQFWTEGILDAALKICDNTRYAWLHLHIERTLTENCRYYRSDNSRIAKLTYHWHSKFHELTLVCPSN